MRKKLIMTCTALGILSLCSYTKVQANLLSYDKIELSELFNNKVDYNMLEDRESGIKVSTETKMYTTTNVNVRTKDTIKSKKITTLSRGSKVIIIDKSHKKWQKINYNGHIRYIHTNYLSKKKPKVFKTPNVYSIKLGELSETQKQRVYTIANICIKEWKNYGVLPSVAIAQAMQESTLGKFCNGNNLWGIKSGAVSYDSLESGVYGYLKVINNGCYGSAPFTRNPSDQISKILAGGYCTPVGDYYNNVMWIINKYDLERFDKMI